MSMAPKAQNKIRKNTKNKRTKTCNTGSSEEQETAYKDEIQLTLDKL